MFLLARRCTEHMSQLPRLKVKVKGFTLEILVRSISPERFRRFSLNFTQMLFSVRRRAEPMTQLCRLKVIVMIYLSMRVRSISPKPFERFSLNFTQMFLLVRRCAEHMSQLLNSWSRSVKLPLNCVSVPYLLIPFAIFIKLYPNVPHSETVHRSHGPAT